MGERSRGGSLPYRRTWGFSSYLGSQGVTVHGTEAFAGGLLTSIGEKTREFQSAMQHAGEWDLGFLLQPAPESKLLKESDVRAVKGETEFHEDMKERNNGSEETGRQR